MCGESIVRIIDVSLQLVLLLDLSGNVLSAENLSVIFICGVVA